MPASSSPIPSAATAKQSQSQSQNPQIMKTTKRRLYFGYGSNLWREQMALRCPKSEFLGVARLRGYRWMINERGYANVAEPIDSAGTGSNRNTFKGEGQVQNGDGGGGEATSKSQVAEKGTEDDNLNHQDQDEEEHENSVWGTVYGLTPSDEARLDINEGVPYAYEKRDVPGIEFWSADSRQKKPEIVDMLVYIDFKRNDGEGYKPREEYIHRMNMGIIDALEAGVPRGYVDRVLRRWIPEEEEHTSGVDEGGEDSGMEKKNNKMSTKKSKARARELALSQARAFKDESGVIPSSGEDN